MLNAFFPEKMSFCLTNLAVIHFHMYLLNIIVKKLQARLLRRSGKSSL